MVDGPRGGKLTYHEDKYSFETDVAMEYLLRPSEKKRRNPQSHAPPGLLVRDCCDYKLQEGKDIYSMRDLALLNEFAAGRIDEELGNLNHGELGQVPYWQKEKGLAEAEGRWISHKKVKRKYESQAERREREREAKVALDLERIRRAAFNRRFKKKRLNDLPARVLAPREEPPEKQALLILPKPVPVVHHWWDLPDPRVDPQAFAREIWRRYIVLPIKNWIKRFYGQYGAIVKVQSVYRGHRARVFVSMLRYEHRSVLRLNGVVTIQRRWRGYLGRCYYLWWRAECTMAAIKIQRAVRDWLNRRRIAELKRRLLAAICIQRYWRGYAVRKEFESLLELAFNRQLHISETYRRIVANRWKRAYFLVKKCAIKIQRCYRRWQKWIKSAGYSEYIRRMRAAYVLQWAWKMYKWHRLVWQAIELEKYRHLCATKLAATWRMHAARRWWAWWRPRELRRVITVQRRARGLLVRAALRGRRAQYHAFWEAARKVKAEIGVGNLLDSLASAVDGDDNYRRTSVQTYPDLAPRPATAVKEPAFRIADGLETSLQNKKSAIPLLRHAPEAVTQHMEPDPLVKVSMANDGDTALREETRAVVQKLPGTTLGKTTRQRPQQSASLVAHASKTGQQPFPGRRRRRRPGAQGGGAAGAPTYGGPGSPSTSILYLADGTSAASLPAEEGGDGSMMLSFAGRRNRLGLPMEGTVVKAPQQHNDSRAEEVNLGGGGLPRQQRPKRRSSLTLSTKNAQPTFADELKEMLGQVGPHKVKRSPKFGAHGSNSAVSSLQNIPPGYHLAQHRDGDGDPYFSSSGTDAADKQALAMTRLPGLPEALSAGAISSGAAEGGHRRKSSSGGSGRVRTPTPEFRPVLVKGSGGKTRVQLQRVPLPRRRGGRQGGKKPHILDPLGAVASNSLRHITPRHQQNGEFD